MGAINDMTTYQQTFGLSSAGSSAGIVFIVYNLGQIAAFPFCPFLGTFFFFYAPLATSYDGTYTDYKV